MAHREPKDWEVCDKASLLGVHTWHYTLGTVVRADQNKEAVVTAISCLHCSVAPPKDVQDRLSHDYEVQIVRDRIAKELNKSQKEGTGVNLTRK